MKHKIESLIGENGPNIPDKYLDIKARAEELINTSEHFRHDMQLITESAIGKLKNVLERLLDYDKYLTAYSIIEMKRFLKKRRKERKKKIRKLKKLIRKAKKFNHPIKLRRYMKQLKKVLDAPF